MEHNQLAPEVSGMVRRLYTGTIASAADGLAGVLSFIINYPWYRSLRKQAIPYLSNGVQVAAEKLSSLSNQVLESEMVTYWKDFIRGI
ncbi:MAG: hypothetical protein ACREBU_21160, partial [Nitrososphaera sp.]